MVKIPQAAYTSKAIIYCSGHLKICSFLSPIAQKLPIGPNLLPMQISHNIKQWASQGHKVGLITFIKAKLGAHQMPERIRRNGHHKPSKAKDIVIDVHISCK